MSGVKNDMSGVKNDMFGVKNDMSGVKNDMFCILTNWWSFSEKIFKKLNFSVQLWASRYFALDPADPTDPAEMGGRTAGPNLPSTRAGGQDGGSYTNSLNEICDFSKKNRKDIYKSLYKWYIGGLILSKR